MNANAFEATNVRYGINHELRKSHVMQSPMQDRGFWQLGGVSDARLRVGLAELLAAGYRTEARIIAHLAEVERRKLYLSDGSESLYDYCIRGLQLSNSEAFHRITAARVARQFPIVFELIEQRRLHLTAVCLLRDYLTQENHRELLNEACHKTKWQVQELLARRFPRPDVESRIRKLPEARVAVARRLAAVPSATLSLATPPPRGPVVSEPHVTALQRRPHVTERLPTVASAGVSHVLDREPATEPGTGATLNSTNEPFLPRPNLPSPPPRPIPIEPLSEARYRIQLNATAALKDKLDRLRALTSHSNPSGDIAIVIERALDLALEQVEKQRFAKTDRPRASRVHFVQTKLKRGVSQQGVRKRGHVPNAVLREIAERDELRCTFRSEDGCRCTARAFLQVHHDWPWARGGGETVENLRLLCGPHNRLLAEREFGERALDDDG
jgi:hypothetical protein